MIDWDLDGITRLVTYVWIGFLGGYIRGRSSGKETP